MERSVNYTPSKTLDLTVLAAQARAAALAPSVASPTYADANGAAPIQPPCTDCNGANPCGDCAPEPISKPAAPVLKDTWFEVNLPNQGDPTIAQQMEVEAAKRKKIMLIGGLLLALLIIGLIVVKQFKKS